MSHPPTEATNAGLAVYCGLLKDELAAQDARKESFERRGLAVVTTAGALATLLFGLAALALSGNMQPLPTESKRVLEAAVIVFVVAGVLALLTNLPVYYQAVTPKGILGKALKDPPDDEYMALRWTARVYEGMLVDAKKKNKRKGYLLFAALVVEIVAIALVAWGVRAAI